MPILFHASPAGLPPMISAVLLPSMPSPAAALCAGCCRGAFIAVCLLWPAAARGACGDYVQRAEQALGLHGQGAGAEESPRPAQPDCHGVRCGKSLPLLPLPAPELQAPASDPLASLCVAAADGERGSGRGGSVAGADCTPGGAQRIERPPRAA